MAALEPPHDSQEEFVGRGRTVFERDVRHRLGAGTTMKAICVLSVRRPYVILRHGGIDRADTCNDSG